MEPAVDVIIPSYNRASTLPKAIDSVLQQTYPHIKLWVIDDGSTDNTAAVCQAYQDQIQIISQSNQGVSAARNTGIRASHHPLISFLDSDDHFHPEKIALQVKALQKKPHYHIVHGDEIWIRNGRRVNPMNKHQKRGGWLFEDSLELCLISPSSVMLKRSLLDSVGLFDERLPACEDYDLWLRITAHHPVLYIDQALTVKYGGHDDQLSRQYWGMDRFRLHAIAKCLESGQLSAPYQHAALTILRKKLAIYLNGAHKRGRIDEINYYQQKYRAYLSKA